MNSRAVFLLGLYFFSGSASLAYEVLWARMLSLQFGVSIFGAVATVTAFMAGLGLGSIAGARWSIRATQPLKLFALCECAVALFAFAMPWVLSEFGVALGTLTQEAGLAAWYAVHFFAAVFLLMLPAFAMGAGFSFMLKATHSTPATLGKLYGFNAWGGTVGALSSLALLPLFGWFAATQIFAAVGLLIAAMAWLLREKNIQQEDTASAPLPPIKTLLLYALVGAAALMLQIGWVRLYGMILLRTEYVLAVIIAVFLAGIGLGSLIAQRMSDVRWMSALPVIAAFGAVTTLWLLAPLSRFIEVAHYSSLFSALINQGGILTLLTLPTTLVLGAWLPLLSVRIGARSTQGAVLYGANSLGAAAGALIAGFVLIPLMGTAATIGVAAMLLLVGGLALVRAYRMWMSVPLIGICAALSSQLPSVASLLPKSQGDTQDIYFREDAISITHVVERRDGQRILLDDLQRMDAASDPDAVTVQRNQARLPLLLHAAPRRVLFLGMGTGISASGALPFPGLEITAVELSEGAIEAAHTWFAPVNRKVAEHIHIVRDDARRFLVRDTHDYDVIIGDLFHPDLAGRSALLSIQQFERARERLSSGGVFVQWIALNQFDARSLDIVLRSFGRVFPDAVLFLDPFRLALVGTKERAVETSAMLANLARLSDSVRYEATGGEGAWTWLGRYWGKLSEVVAQQGPVQDETAPRIEFLLPKARYRGDLDLAALLARLLKQRPHWEQAAAALRVPIEQREKFEKAYAATELSQLAWLALLRDQPDEEARLLRLAYQANPLDRWVSSILANNAWTRYEDALRRGENIPQIFGKDEREVLEAILHLHADFVPALKALHQFEIKKGNRDAAQDLYERIRTLSPLDRSMREGK